MRNSEEGIRKAQIEKKKIVYVDCVHRNFESVSCIWNILYAPIASGVDISKKYDRCSAPDR